MKFDKVINSILENTVQDMMTVNQLGIKQLTHNITKDPRLLLDLIKKTPGMYADLLSGRMEQLNQKFLQMGVDFKKIVNLVDQARELANRERMGKRVPVRKAVPLTNNKI